MLLLPTMMYLFLLFSLVMLMIPKASSPVHAFIISLVFLVSPFYFMATRGFLPWGAAAVWFIGFLTFLLIGIFHPKARWRKKQATN